MQVILLEKMGKLGGLGDQVNVKPGFGRNYLIPQGKAVPATDANIADFEARRAELEAAAAEQLAAANARAEKMDGLEVVITRKAGDDGRMFGSVTNIDIADAICATGNEIEKREIRMPIGAIRELGEYEITAHLHADVDVTVKVLVEAE